MKYRKGLVIAIGAGAMGLTAPVSANIFDTIPEWDGITRSNGWDKIAQTLIVPGGKPILSTFELGAGADEDGRTFTLRVYAWDRTSEHTTGPELFSSGPHAAPNGSIDFMEFNIGIALTPGSEYAVIADWDQTDGGNGVAYIVGSSYTDGYANFTDGGFDEPWSFGQNSNFDMAFRAVFEVPAPGALALLGAAALIGRRRSRT